MAQKKAAREVFLYHSFPRHYDKDNTRHDLGIGTLKRILEMGLLLVPESQPVPGCGPFPDVHWLQHRLCFTATTRENIRAHSRVFGQFSLEFTSDALRQFGAQPAFYLTSRRSNIGLLNDGGDALLRHLLEAYRVLSELKELTRTEDPSQKMVRRAAERVVSKIFPSSYPFETLKFAVQGVLNFYYPTDREKTRDGIATPALHFFRQQEWKIIPNMAWNGQWIYHQLTPRQKRKLSKFNPDFFNAVVFGRPRIEHCMLFPEVNGVRIVDQINQIIVPPGAVNRVRMLVKRAVEKGRLQKVIPVVSLSSFSDSNAMANLDRVACT